MSYLLYCVNAKIILKKMYNLQLMLH